MHSDYTLLMSMALDHEASASDLARLHAHVASCAECRRVWDDWQAINHRMLAAPRLEAPADLVAQVSARLAARELRRRRLRWLGTGLVLSWLALLVSGVLNAAGLFAWLGADLQQASAVTARLALALPAVNGLLRGIVAGAESVGAPVLAAVVGGLASLTCALAVIWLWLLAPSGRIDNAPIRGE